MWHRAAGHKQRWGVGYSGFIDSLQACSPHHTDSSDITQGSLKDFIQLLLESHNASYNFLIPAVEL